MSDRFSFSILHLSCLSLLSTTSPPIAEMVPQQRERSPPLAESQPSKDVSSFSSSTSSPWDSPNTPFQALQPVPARAQSAPITLPTEPVDPIKSPAAASPPRSVDAFSSVSWSQSQWIAFSDNFAPPRRQGSGSSAKELQKPPSGPGRSSRFLSDDPADACCKAASREDGNACFSDVFSGVTDRAMAAAPSSKVFNGNSIADAWGLFHAWGLELQFNTLFCFNCQFSFCTFVSNLKLNIFFNVFCCFFSSLISYLALCLVCLQIYFCEINFGMSFYDFHLCVFLYDFHSRGLAAWWFCICLKKMQLVFTCLFVPDFQVV